MLPICPALKTWSLGKFDVTRFSWHSCCTFKDAYLGQISSADIQTAWNYSWVDTDHRF